MRSQAPTHSRRRFLRGSLGLAGLGLLAGCGLVSVPAAPKVHRIGLLEPDSPATNPGTEDLGAIFRAGLGELGYVERHNLVIEHRSAEGRIERLPELAAELVALRVDLLVARGDGPAQAAKDATGSVPIVAVSIGDPVEAGLVAGLARPGGNITGLASLSPQLAAKRLELLTQVAPGISRVGIFWGPTSRRSQIEHPHAMAAASAIGLQAVPLEVRGAEDVAVALGAALTQRVEALVLPQIPMIQNQRGPIFDFAVRERLPTSCNAASLAGAGGLMYYGPNVDDLWRRAVAYVDKILKGARPGDLPVEQPTEFDFVLNLRTARALGLTIPPSVLQQVTEVIQ